LIGVSAVAPVASMAASQNPAAIDRHRILITLFLSRTAQPPMRCPLQKRARRRKAGNIPARN